MGLLDGPSVTSQVRRKEWASDCGSAAEQVAEWVILADRKSAEGEGGGQRRALGGRYRNLLPL